MKTVIEPANPRDAHVVVARPRAVVVLCLGFALLCSGCATFNGAGKSVIDQYPAQDPDGKGQVVVSDAGGAGAPATGVQAADAAHRIPTLQELLTYNLGHGATIEEQRNAYLSREVIQIDEQYDRFVRTLYQNRTRTDLGTALLQLFLGVAGTLTDSTGVQKNYAAGSALITGGNVAIDKNVFLDKTVSAIISSMEAQRGRMLVRLRAGMNKSILEYPIVDAQADLYAYQRAGTMIGGLSFIEQVAKEDASDSRQAIEALPLLTETQMQEKKCVSFSLIPPHADTLTMDGLTRAVAALATDADRPASTRQAMIDYLKQRKSQPDGVEPVYTAMKSAGLLQDPCTEDR